MAKAQAKDKTIAALKELKKEVSKDKPKKEAVQAAPSVTYTLEQINKVMNYLGNRPYIEVADIIQVLQSGKSS